MNYNELPEFRKKFKKLAKKYRSLFADLLEFKKVLNQNPFGTGKHFNILTRNDRVVILKARFFSRYLKGSSLRIIYSYLETEKLIEFLEIYFKGEQENENRARISYYLKTYGAI